MKGAKRSFLLVLLMLLYGSGSLHYVHVAAEHAPVAADTSCGDASECPGIPARNVPDHAPDDCDKCQTLTSLSVALTVDALPIDPAAQQSLLCVGPSTIADCFAGHSWLSRGPPIHDII